MKKLISLLLGLMLVVTATGITVFATELQTVKIDNMENFVETITPVKARRLSIEQLQSAARCAKTDEQASIVLDELILKVSQNPEMAASSTVINTYFEKISCTSSTPSSSSLYTTITVKYKIKARVPSGAHLDVGCRYPVQTRIPEKLYNVGGETVNTIYTKTFSNMFKIPAKQAFVKFSARDYTERTELGRFYGRTNVETDYHTVTEGEVKGTWLVKKVAPKVIMKIYPATKVVKIIADAVKVGANVYYYFSNTEKPLSLPNPVAGQYYETRTWYENNQLKCHIKVWSSQSSYNSGGQPIFNSGVFTAANLPGF